MSASTPQPERPTLKQLGWSIVVAGVGLVLWTMAIIAVITDEIHALRAPLINLCLVLAATASVSATKLGLDYRRRLTDHDWHVLEDARARARHHELLEAVQAGMRLQETHHQMLVERIEATATEADQARWRLLAENLRAELGTSKSNGAKSVVPMHRPSGPPAG